jgi:hypothetical protein
MKRDRVEVVVDTGGGTQTFVIEATKAGRRVEVSTSRGTVEVTEVTRTGQPVRAGRFMAARVVAIVESPGEDEAKSERKDRPRDQASFL